MYPTNLTSDEIGMIFIMMDSYLSKLQIKTSPFVTDILNQIEIDSIIREKDVLKGLYKKLDKHDISA